MRIGIIIQARMGSQRLPGKVLQRVAGKPLLEYLLERLERGTGGLQRVVATSTEAPDDPLEQFCAARGIPCHLGPMLDVAGRFWTAARVFGFDGFVRLSADSPLLDQGLVDWAVRLFCGGAFDLVTNVAIRSFPHGQSVEVVRTSAFARACGTMDEAADREHVTRFFYRNPAAFAIHNFTACQDYSDLQFSVDTPADAQRCAALLSCMERPHWQYGWRELIELSRHLEKTAVAGMATWTR